MKIDARFSLEIQRLRGIGRLDLLSVEVKLETILIHAKLLRAIRE